MKNAVKVVASFFSSTIRSSRASYFLLTRQLLLAHAPATSCSRTSFFLLTHQLLLAHAPASSCSRASFFLLTHQLLLVHAPAISCSHASFFLLTRQLHLAGAPASSCSCRKLFRNIPLKKKKLLSRRHWIGNGVEMSEALEVAGICTNKGRLSFEGAMLR